MTPGKRQMLCEVNRALSKDRFEASCVKIRLSFGNSGRQDNR
jgi:hypothetical protein